MTANRKRLRTIIWSLKAAWKIDKRSILCWGGLSMLLAVLPSVSIKFYQLIISGISDHIDSGTGSYAEMSVRIVVFGIILIFTGLSERINGDLLYMVMYDSYYLGMQQMMMDTIQKIDIEDMRKKEIKDEYNAIIVRAGSLTDLISASCLLISRVFGTILLLGVSFTYSKTIFLLALLYVGFVCIMNYRYSNKNRSRTKQIREAERRVRQIEEIPSMTSAAKEIRVFSAKKRILDIWDRAYDEIDRQKKDQNYSKEKESYLLGAGFYVFNISVLAYAIYRVCTRNMTPDLFLVLYSLCQNFSQYISDITKSYLDADYGVFSLERQMDFVEMVEARSVGVQGAASNRKEPENDEKTAESLPRNTGSAEIEFRNVSYSYGDGPDVLHNISISIPKGEVVALVGYNGSGKTTLTKLLLGLYHPTSGKIFVEGNDYADISAKYINSRIGVFFQQYSLFHASLRENIGFGDVEQIENRELIREALRRGGADSIAESMKDGIDSWLFRAVRPDGYELSGGQRQKIAVSRAYMNNKDILIFDEPAAALDPIAEMKQFQEIRNHLNGKTAILISHRIGFARMADRIIVLNEGTVAEEGTHEQLMSKKGLYHMFYTQQAEWYRHEEREEEERGA